MDYTEMDAYDKGNEYGRLVAEAMAFAALNIGTDEDFMAFIDGFYDAMIDDKELLDSEQ